MIQFKDLEPYLDEALTEVIGQAVMLGISSHKNSPMIERFFADAQDKFAQGQAEHQDDWADWDLDRLRAEMRDELIDAVIYMAVLRMRLSCA